MVELFILLAMIFGIMAPIFVPIVGGILWGFFEAFKFLFPFTVLLCILLMVLDWIRIPKKPCRGKLLYERAQLEKERDELLRDKEYKDRPWPKPGKTHK